MAQNTNLSRIGQINAAGDDRALFLKVFSGETMATFDKVNLMKSRHMTKTIAYGKSAQFTITGTATADYFDSGTNILDPANGLLNNILRGERVINIDKPLISAVAISEDDMKLNHDASTAIQSEELGRALANQFDASCIKVAYAAARTEATLTRDGDRIFGGTRIFSDAAGGGEGADDVNLGFGATFTSAIQLSDALFAAKTALDEKNVPAEDRCAIMPSAEYNLLISEFPETQLNRVLNQDIGGQGSYAQGTLGKIAGFEILSSNNMPNGQDLSAVDDGGSNNDVFGANGIGYNGDFTGSRILCFHKSAIGTVQLMDLATEMEWKMEYQTNLYVAKYMLGHGVLRPEAAVEISDGNLT